LFGVAVKVEFAMHLKMRPIKRGSGKAAPDAAVAVLRRTDNPAVMSGDDGLLHDIAEELGWPHDAWLTPKRVLDAIDRHNSGQLVKRLTRGIRGRVMRIFYLPETAAERGIKPQQA
jgi:hypothetical protein